MKYLSKNKTLRSLQKAAQKHPFATLFLVSLALLTSYASYTHLTAYRDGTYVYIPSYRGYNPVVWESIVLLAFLLLYSLTIWQTWQTRRSKVIAIAAMACCWPIATIALAAYAHKALSDTFLNLAALVLFAVVVGFLIIGSEKYWRRFKKKRKAGLFARIHARIGQAACICGKNNNKRVDFEVVRLATRLAAFSIVVPIYVIGIVAWDFDPIRHGMLTLTAILAAFALAFTWTAITAVHSGHSLRCALRYALLRVF